MNKVLFLTTSAQNHHWLSDFTYTDRTYDLNNWIEGFKEVKDIDLHVLDYYAEFIQNGFEPLQEKLLKMVNKEKYDFIILPTIFYEVKKETFESIKQLGTKIIVCFFDDSMRFKNYNIYYCQVADYIITHETINSLDLYNHYGYKANFFPNLPSYSFYNKKSNYIEELVYDVSFVGANIADRQMYFDILKGSGLKVGFFGRGWDNGYVDTNKMLSLFKSSKIILNFTKTIDNQGNNQLKGRIFEICMSEGFLLTEYFSEIEQYYDIGKDIESFKNEEELLEKINYYLKNNKERESIKISGYNKTKELYSHENLWSDFFNNINNKVKNTIDNFTALREHKINFLMWNISFIKAYKSKNDLKSMQEYRDNIINSRYYSQALVELLSEDVSIFDNPSLYKILRDEITENTLTNLNNQKILTYDTLKVKAMNFVDDMRVDKSNVLYKFTPSQKKENIYSSVYACLIYDMFNEIKKLPKEHKEGWVEYFNSFQNEEDGLWYDDNLKNELYDDTDWWGARHLAVHIITAYTSLGIKPKYKIKYVEKYYDLDFLKTWLDKENWNSYFTPANDVDNKIMNVAVVLQYNRDFYNDTQAERALKYLCKYLNSKINHETGLWGVFDINNPQELSRSIQFAYHLYMIYFYDNKTIKYKDKIVELALKTQNIFGGFAPHLNSSACEDIDSSELLIKLTNRDNKKVNIALSKYCNWVMSNQNKDGGFVFKKGEKLVYGHKIMTSKANESQLFATWFRILSVVKVKKYLEYENSFKYNHSVGY